jgi:hypothetical protein
VWENFEFQLYDCWNVNANYHGANKPPCTSNLCTCYKVLNFSCKFHMFLTPYDQNNWITVCFYTTVQEYHCHL